MINSSVSEFVFDKKHQLFLNFIEHTDQAKNAVQYMESIIPDITLLVPKQSIFQYLDVGCGYRYKTQLKHLGKDLHQNCHQSLILLKEDA